MICILHDQDEYGVVRWPLKQLAQAVHASVSSLRNLVQKDILKGADTGSTCEAFIYTPRSGRKDGEPVVLIAEQPGPIWYSSRMVRDEYVKNNAGAATRFGGDGPPSPSQRQGERQGEGRVRAKTPNPSRARASSSVSDPDSTSVSGNGSCSLPPGDLFVSEEKDPSPKNGDAETSSQKPKDVEAFAIWNMGVAKLRSCGIADRDARSFIGKQIQVYGKSVVARAVTEMLAQDPVEPKAYLVALLQTGTGARQGTSKVGNSLGACGRVLAEKEAQRDAAAS